MKKHKKALLMSMAFTSLMMTTQVMATDYDNHPLKSGIENAVQRGLIKSSDKIFPDKATTRGEFASMIVKATGVKTSEAQSFHDVPKSHSFYEDIQKAFSAKLIFGYSDTIFKPDQQITREEMALMIMRFVKRSDLPIPRTDIKTFNDKRKMRYADTIQNTRKLGIVSGYGDNSFRPLEPITKAESIAFLVRSIKKIELHERNNNNSPINKVVKEKMESVVFVEEPQSPPSQLYQSPSPVENKVAGKFKVYFKTKEPIATNSLQEALAYFEKENGDSYIEENGEIIEMNKGFGRTKVFTLIYNEITNKDFTYVGQDVELEVLSVKNDKVIVTLGGQRGYVYKKDIKLIPYIKTHERSYYISNSGYLYHKVYKNNKYESYKIGNAPLFMERGMPYYTSEGYVFDEREAYQYFNYLPLRSDIQYTGDDLNRYIAWKSPDSPLKGYGQTFIDKARKYNMNAMYLLANAIHESGWGKSKIAIEKNNLFGFRATDSDAYGNAASFATLTEGIDYCAKYISERYLTPGSWTYQNAILGNKGIGMNVRYASDPYWGAKIAGHMNEIDEYLGTKERHKFKIGKVKQGITPYYLSGSALKPLNSFDIERIVAITGIEKINSIEYYRVFSDDNKYSVIYILPSQFQEILTY